MSSLRTYNRFASLLFRVADPRARLSDVDSMLILVCELLEANENMDKKFTALSEDLSRLTTDNLLSRSDEIHELQISPKQPSPPTQIHVIELGVKPTIVSVVKEHEVPKEPTIDHQNSVQTNAPAAINTEDDSNHVNQNAVPTTDGEEAVNSDKGKAEAEEAVDADEGEAEAEEAVDADEGEAEETTPEDEGEIEESTPVISYIYHEIGKSKRKVLEHPETHELFEFVDENTPGGYLGAKLIDGKLVRDQ